MYRQALGEEEEVKGRIKAERSPGLRKVTQTERETGRTHL